MLGCVPPSFMLLLMCCMPETPRFLLTQHKHQEAMAAVQFLWGSEQGWEEPPIGAEHQVRAGRQNWREGVGGVAPHFAACSQGCTCACSHTHGGGRCCPVRERAKACSSPTPWLDPSLGDHWESLSFDLTVLGRERSGQV